MEVAHCLTGASRAQENENDNKRMNVESECPMFETQEISAATSACICFDCRSSVATAFRAAAAAQPPNFRERRVASVSLCPLFLPSFLLAVFLGLSLGPRPKLLQLVSYSRSLNSSSVLLGAEKKVLKNLPRRFVVVSRSQPGIIRLTHLHAVIVTAL
jgi:hypothetical protein